MTDPPLPTVRESADALGIRLARIGAAAVTLRGISAARYDLIAREGGTERARAALEQAGLLPAEAR